MKNEIICSECGRVLREETIHKFEERCLCQNCIDSLTTICDCCGKRIWRHQAEGDTFTVLCHQCYQSCYTYCEECGVLIHNDDAYSEDDSDYVYCRDCFERIRSNPIKDYNYKPEPIFYGNEPLFLGIELEIDKGGEYSENAKEILDYINKDKVYAYAKHDGSLHDGMELVFHPMNLSYCLNNINWSGLFEKIISMGYRSHQTETCGLHCHVNRSAFGSTLEAQESVIARIVFFVENHWNELLKFSRRTEYNMNRWASRYGIAENTYDTYQKAKEKCLGRYVAVNLENYSTIEFRLFRGTLKYQTFAATLQLVHAICQTCINMTDKELEGLSWSSFVLGIKDKPELIRYLKSKQLYVNELIEDTEEI